MYSFFDSLNAPKSCRVDNVIFKKLFYENSGMSKKDREIFASDVKKIIWRFSFKENTINIQPYIDGEREYEEVAVIEVVLENVNKAKRITQIIQRTIPYPVLLVITYENSMLVSAAHKRVNMADRSKNAVEEFIYTDWINFESPSDREMRFLESIDIRKLSFSNFYRFYSDMVDRINLLNASEIAGGYSQVEGKDPQKVKELMGRIGEVEKRVAELKGRIKKEASFSNKVRINIEIKKQEEIKKALIGQFGEQGE